MDSSHNDIEAVRRSFRLDFIVQRADLAAQTENAWSVAAELWKEDAAGFEVPLSFVIGGEHEDA